MPSITITSKATWSSQKLSIKIPIKHKSLRIMQPERLPPPNSHHYRHLARRWMRRMARRWWSSSRRTIEPRRRRWSSSSSSRNYTSKCKTIQGKISCHSCDSHAQTENRALARKPKSKPGLIFDLMEYPKPRLLNRQFSQPRPLIYREVVAISHVEYKLKCCHYGCL